MSTHSLYPLITCLLLPFTITSAQSQYYVQCSNQNYSLGPIDINETTIPTTLSNIQIPINKNNETCLLRIKLLGGTYNFEENSACTITFDISEVTTPTPTTSDPTEVPTPDPTVIPTVNPTSTVSPTASPTALTTTPTTTPTNTPTTSEPTATVNPTEVPTNIPTYIPTIEPTTVPTASPTESNIIDLDELELYNIFSTNDENIFWKTHYFNGTYYFEISPGCINNMTTFADEPVDSKSNSIIDLRLLVSDVFGNDSDTTIHDFNVSEILADMTPLFPSLISITSHDSNISSIFSYSQAENNSVFECYYKDAFETNINDSIIDYYLFIEDMDNTTKRDNIVIDISINKICINDPTDMPTAQPTIDFNAFTSTINSDSDDDSDEDNFLGLGVGLEIFIAIIVVAFVILLASVIVGVCLCKRKNIWEDNEDDEAIIRLKEPKTVKETELVTNKFMVTEDDHAEMLELAKRSSLSTGLQV